MSTLPQYFYKDFETGKRHFTRAPFVGWTQGGPLNTHYAMFQRPSELMLIPIYLLFKETKALLPPPSEQKEEEEEEA